MAGTELIVSFFFFCLHFIFHSSTVFVFVERVAKDVAVMDRFFFTEFCISQRNKKGTEWKKEPVGFFGIFTTSRHVLPSFTKFYQILPSFTYFYLFKTVYLILPSFT